MMVTNSMNAELNKHIELTLIFVSESCHSFLVFQKFYIFILYWNTFGVSRAHLVKPIGVVLSLLPIDCLHYKK